MSSRIVDFTKTWWGHNVEMMRSVSEHEVTAFLISSPSVREGDVAKWATEYGTATAQAISVKWFPDPGDMVQAELKIVARHSNDGQLLWHS